jgi:hypothetical protein
MINWDVQEKQMETSLAKISVLRQKAMNLALELAESQNIPTISNNEISIGFLLEMSVGDDSKTRLSLRRTIGELLRAETTICSKFS